MIYLLSAKPRGVTTHLPMISFSLCEQSIDFDGIDLLMFTSKQAIVSIEALNPRWKEIPTLAIGEATASKIEALGGTVAYQPKSFYGKNLAQDILTYFQDKKILYLRPKEVSFDSREFLEKAGVVLDEKIIYETSCIRYSKRKKPPKDAIIIFTSPSTIACFLENFGWDESYRAVVIGKATQKHLPPNAHYTVANSPKIDACIAKANEVLLSSKPK